MDRINSCVERDSEAGNRNLSRSLCLMTKQPGTNIHMKFKNNRFPGGVVRQRTSRPGAYKEFDATELYCPRCRRAVPVRKRLLLVLPEGDKYEYLCKFCSESVGTKIDRQTQPVSVVV